MLRILQFELAQEFIPDEPDSCGHRFSPAPIQGHVPLEKRHTTMIFTGLRVIRLEPAESYS